MGSMTDLANYVVLRAVKKGKPITNLHLQKILYFVFRDAIAEDKYIDNLKKIYDEEFLVWRHGPALNSVENMYSTYGSLEIDEPFQLPKRDYSFLNKFIDNRIDTSVLSLVNESHQHSHWVQNKKEIKGGRGSVRYPFNVLNKD